MAPRTIAIATMLAIALLSAGCLSGGPATETTGPDEPRSTPSATATDQPTPSATGPMPTATGATPSDAGATPTATETPFDTVAASNEPDPSKHVRLENRWDETVTIDVRVVRNATGMTVHNASYDLDPGADRTVYNTVEADPDGIEGFTIVASARNTTDRVRIETSECYGYAHATVADGGALELYYPIC